MLQAGDACVATLNRSCLVVPGGVGSALQFDERISNAFPSLVWLPVLRWHFVAEDLSLSAMCGFVF